MEQNDDYRIKRRIQQYNNHLIDTASEIGISREEMEDSLNNTSETLKEVLGVGYGAVVWADDTNPHKTAWNALKEYITTTMNSNQCTFNSSLYFHLDAIRFKMDEIEKAIIDGEGFN